jgi:hypothetical protein
MYLVWEQLRGVVCHEREGRGSQLILGGGSLSVSTQKTFFLTINHVFCQEDIKTLCSYVCKEYTSTFKNIEYVNTFKGLFLRVEQEIDRVRKKEEEASKNNER